MVSGIRGQAPKAPPTPTPTTQAPVSTDKAAPAPAPADAKKPAAPGTRFDGVQAKHGRLIEVKTDAAPAQKANAALAKDVQQARTQASVKSQHTAAVKTKEKIDPEFMVEIYKVQSEANSRTYIRGAVEEQIHKLPPDRRADFLKALPRDLQARLEHEITGEGYTPGAELQAARLQNMSTEDRQKTLAGMEDKDVQALAEVSRAGGIPDDNLKVSLGIEQAARTDWGHGHQDTVDHLRKLQSDGKLVTGSTNGSAETSPEGAITLEPGLLASPEATAATLAHEGTHSQHATHGGMGHTLAEETSGNLAGAEVWREIGNPRDKAVPDGTLKELNKFRTALEDKGEAGVRGLVASEYASFIDARHDGAKRSNKPGWVAKQQQLFDDLAADKGAQGTLTKEQAREIYKAALHTGIPAESVGKALRNAPKEVREAIVESLKADGQDKDTIATYRKHAGLD